MACPCGGLGYMSFEFLALSAATANVSDAPKLLGKETKIHPARWLEWERPVDANLSVDKEIGPKLSKLNQTYRPSSLPPDLETIEEQECQVHSDSRNVGCAPFRFCILRGRTWKPT